MELLRFVNSKDIREHLRKINYSFDPLEAAWLIYQCHDATVKEKHAAWKELIDSMPDCRIEERSDTLPFPSLHDFLREYMEIEDKWMADFCGEGVYSGTKNSGYVYKLRYTYKDGRTFDHDTVFSSYQKIREILLEPEFDLREICCTKMKIDDLNWSYHAYLNKNGEILRLRPKKIMDDRELDINEGVFAGLWFDFPTPFKRGDILWDPQMPDDGDHFASGPFVNLGINLERISSEKSRNWIKENGDETDMAAEGYFSNPDGSIYKGCVSGCMDLEYYPHELQRPRSTLKAASNLILGRIDALLFANAYHQLLTEHYAKTQAYYSCDGDGLELAGIE